MKLQQLARHELHDLEMTANTFAQRVETALSTYRKDKVRLFLPDKEKYRLLKLRVWMERYNVDLLYILERLIPLWEGFIKRRTKALKSQGLGVKVATLTGKKSEQFLKDMVDRDYPSDTNKELVRINKQNRILNREKSVVEDGIKTKSDGMKNLFDFNSPKGYMQYYKRRISRQTHHREHIIQLLKKYPYRGNPFL
jgi:hypothetical protein